MRMRNYVVGLAHDGQYMAFVRKNRPAWQAGLLNGIGGKVELNETFYEAMIREFKEETGTRITNWRRLATLTYPDQAMIAFYTARVSPDVLRGLYTATDEAVEVHSNRYWMDSPGQFISNLKWIIPLALHEEEYAQVRVDGYSDPVMGPIKQNSTYSLPK